MSVPVFFVCVNCVCPRAYIRNYVQVHTWDFYQIFVLIVAYGCCSALFWRRCDELCASALRICLFAQNGPWGIINLSHNTLYASFHQVHDGQRLIFCSVKHICCGGKWSNVPRGTILCACRHQLSSNVNLAYTSRHICISSCCQSQETVYEKHRNSLHGASCMQ